MPKQCLAALSSPTAVMQSAQTATTMISFAGFSLPRQWARQTVSAVWSLRHASLLRRINGGQLKTREVSGWVQVEPPKDQECVPSFGRLWLFGQPIWEFQFSLEGMVTPGLTGAGIIFADPLPWPVLARTRQGLLIPRAAPLALSAGCPGMT